jgi:hypothetical protein
VSRKENALGDVSEGALFHASEMIEKTKKLAIFPNLCDPKT